MKTKQNFNVYEWKPDIILVNRLQNIHYLIKHRVQLLIIKMVTLKFLRIRKEKNYTKDMFE